MVRNLSSTPVVVLAEGCSDVEALTTGGEAVSMSPASEEVGPSGSILRKFVRRPAESRAAWPGSGGNVIIYYRFVYPGHMCLECYYLLFEANCLTQVKHIFPMCQNLINFYIYY